MNYQSKPQLPYLSAPLILPPLDDLGDYVSGHERICLVKACTHISSVFHEYEFSSINITKMTSPLSTGAKCIQFTPTSITPIGVPGLKQMLNKHLLMKYSLKVIMLFIPSEYTQLCVHIHPLQFWFLCCFCLRHQNTSILNQI